MKLKKLAETAKVLGVDDEKITEHRMIGLWFNRVEVSAITSAFTTFNLK